MDHDQHVVKPLKNGPQTRHNSGTDQLADLSKWTLNSASREVGSEIKAVYANGIKDLSQKIPLDQPLVDSPPPPPGEGWGQGSSKMNNFAMSDSNSRFEVASLAGGLAVY